MKTLISSVILITFLISQTCLAAEYQPPTDSSPATLRFNNILIDSSSTTSAVLTATDNAILHGGQVYLLDVNQLQPATGKQDADYNSDTGNFTSQGILATSNYRYDLTLLHTQVSVFDPGLFEFTVMELRALAQGVESTAGEPAVFLQGSKGDPGPQGPPGIFDMARVYRVYEEDKSSVLCHNPNDLLISGGANCKHTDVLIYTGATRNLGHLRFGWGAFCLSPSQDLAAPSIIEVFCLSATNLVSPGPASIIQPIQ